MKTLITTEVGEESGKATLQYQFDHAALERLGSQVLGKTILFTNNYAWTDDEIVLAYRGQSHVEDAFRTMKNPHFISIRPMYHWTDSMIRVHVFYLCAGFNDCVFVGKAVASQGNRRQHSASD